MAFVSLQNKILRGHIIIARFLEFAGELLDTRRREILKRRLKRMNGMKSMNSVVGACEDGPSILELTRDHHPDREDEKLRIEAAGGFVVDYGGLPRVNGQLAVSRSIGDLALKK
jgi:hypothetical protein